MREGLTVIIALLILGIVLDGIRRMRAHRRDSLRMARRMADDGGVEERELTSSEFPSGGARVAARRDPNDLEHINQHLKENYAASKMTRGAPNRIPEQVSLNLDTSVPMLMDSVEAQEEPAEESDLVSSASEGDRSARDDREPALGDFANLDDLVEKETSLGTAVAEQPEPAQADSAAGTQPEESVHPEPVKPVREGARAQKRREEQERAQAAKVDAESSTKLPDEVLIINVMARRGQQFSGPDLLDAMVNQDLKFGDMDIFHRHENADGTGKILFSVANIVVPGTFELGAMEDFSTPGISMFLSLPIPGDSIAAFNLMAESAHAISQQLDGELKDENRSVMTRQTIEHARQRVVEYERKRRLSK